RSPLAVDRDLECFTDLAHAPVAGSAAALDQRPTETLSIESRFTTDTSGIGSSAGSRSTSVGIPRIVGRARPNQRAVQTRDRSISREHDHRPAPDAWKLARSRAKPNTATMPELS